MGENPYRIDPEVDADLFEEREKKQRKEAEARKTKRAELGGHVISIDEECPSCGVVHDIDGLENMPEEVREQLSTLLDMLPAGVQERLLAPHAPPAIRMAESFLAFLHALDAVNFNGPVLRAIYEGHVGEAGAPYWEHYELERMLILTHHGLKSINNQQDASRAQESGHEIMNMFGMLIGFLQARLASIEVSYRKSCNSLKLEVDELLVSSGTYTDQKNVNKVTRHLMLEGIVADLDLRKQFG
ncbi:MAG TPA: hypothetical protein VJ742_13125 [Nitrososphaera sp.]|nr:hypothetical protein [Nitrososphaera sp.]